MSSAGLKAERNLAKRLGAWLHPRSGAFDGMKADMTLGDSFLIEAKSTSRASIGVKFDWLKKLRYQALGKNKSPLLAIQFTDGGGDVLRGGSWVAIPESEFRELISHKELT